MIRKIYIIFSNAALADMAAKAPRTMEEFLAVSGVGQIKAQRPRPGAGPEGGVLRLSIDAPLRLQAVQIGPDPLPGLLPQEAVGGQAVQPQLPDPLAAAAPEDLDDQRRPHVVPQLVPDPLDAGEDHLGLDSDVRLSVDPPAAAAVAAPVRVGLSEVGQDTAPEALGGLAVVHHFTGSGYP